MAYTLGEAAKVTGKSGATISAAIKSGRISARKDDTGTFRIDPAELHRIYPRIVYSDTKGTPANIPEKPPEKNGLEAAISALQARLDAAQDVIADLREDRDRWRQQATALLGDHRPPKGLIARLFGH